MIPWALYEGRLSDSSAGRISLEKAFALLVYDRIGFESWELSEIFSGPDDDNETGAARELVRIQAELMTDGILNGQLSTFARRIGGGEIITLKPNVWEIDEPIHRFALASFNLERWMDIDAQPTHRIFLSEEQFKLWASQLQRPEFMSEEQFFKILDPLGTAEKAAAQDEKNQQSSVENEKYHQLPHDIADPPGVGPRFLKLPIVADRVGLSKSSIYERISKGEFPEPKKIGASSRWLESEITDWIKDKASKEMA